MAEQLWSDERIAKVTHGLYVSADRVTVISIETMRSFMQMVSDDLQAALDAANATINELQDALDGMRGIAQQRQKRVEELEAASAMLRQSRDALLEQLERATHGQIRLEAQLEWEPLPNGRYDGADVYYYFYLLGGELCVFEAETGDGWPLQLPDNIRLCRRKEAGE